MIDFGSTYTKVTAVEISDPRLLGCASAFSTVDTDINEGLTKALAELEIKTGKIEYSRRMACSSAAGGLKMIASGLVPELTAKAASLAAMGAGAKITGLYSYELTEDDIDEITVKSPDIFLLTGGTDGGNKKCILHNAKLLAEIPGDYPIIFAGNRNCGREVMQILAHRRVYVCENVMPAIGVLNIDPARQMIRDIFLERIIQAKGLSDDVIMPTPVAVLTAAELLAQLKGDLIMLDVGGATTDVCSIGEGAPRGSNTVYRGLPEPFAKRTVEGDIGMRYSVSGIVEAGGMQRIIELAGSTGLQGESVQEYIQYITNHTDALPVTTVQKNIDFALAAVAIETATQRHAGTLEEVYTSSGRAYIQTGKDLTDVETIILTGGALLNSDMQTELAKHALFNEMKPQSLRPKKAEIFTDSHYIIAAMGLLSTCAPGAATEIMISNIKNIDQ